MAPPGAAHPFYWLNYSEGVLRPYHWHCSGLPPPPPCYGIQMRVHDRYCLVQSRGAKQKSKKKALQ